MVKKLSRKMRVGLTKFVKVSCPKIPSLWVSGDENVFFPPDTGRVPFIWRSMACFGEEGRGLGRSE